jgi:hypothetical protein
MTNHNLNLPDPKVNKVTFILNEGETIDEEKYPDFLRQLSAQKIKHPTVCAKKVYNTKTRLNTYYILCFSGQMFDPNQTDIRYKARNRWKFRRVNRSTFQTYCTFLKTKHQIFLRHAERNI